MVYSTNPDFQIEEDEQEQETLLPNEQRIYVSHDRKMRKGKTVTLVEGFIGRAEDLDELSKQLKAKCGVGGSAKDGCILLQGEHRDKVKLALEAKGYQVKLKGG